MKGLDTLRDLAAEHGWAHTPSLVAEALTDPIVAAWRAEVAPFQGALMRQYNAVAETHHRSPDGLVTNSLHNPHALGEFPRFSAAIQALEAAVPLRACAEALLGGPVLRLQSAFFESSIGSLPHRDDHPYRAEGAMVGVWIALEPITLQAGPFQLWPHTHLLEDDELDRLGRLVWHRRHVLAEPAGPETEALMGHLLPILEGRSSILATIPRGDALWWHRRTVHGSRPPTPGSQQSRLSLIFHYILAADAPGG